MTGFAQPTNRPAAPRWSLWSRIAGFLLAALVALTVPGAAHDHVDPVFELHLHDAVTGQEVSLVDSRGHARWETNLRESSAFGADQSMQAAISSSSIPSDLLLAGWILLAAGIVLVFHAAPTAARWPAGTLLGPRPPPPR